MVVAVKAMHTTNMHNTLIESLLNDANIGPFFKRIVLDSQELFLGC